MPTVCEDRKIGRQEQDPHADDVTVVITNWNYGQYLAPCLNSILAQTKPPADWYVVDDGSDDIGSHFVYQQLEPRRLHIGKHEGCCSAYNRGLLLCTTPWVIFLDADDELDPQYIEKTMAAAKQHSVDWVYTDAMATDEQGKSKFPITFKPFDLTELRKKNFIHSAALVKTHLMRLAGGFMGICLEDWELWKRIAATGKTAAWVQEPLLRYRQHGQSRNNGGRGL